MNNIEFLIWGNYYLQNFKLSDEEVQEIHNHPDFADIVKKMHINNIQLAVVSKSDYESN